MTRAPASVRGPQTGDTRRQRQRRKAGRFARRDALHGWTLHFGPNMTPMVDVVMVILIFFMASAAFFGSEWFLRAAIPPEQAGKGAAAAKRDPMEIPPTRLTVNLDVSDGRVVGTFLEVTKGSIDEVVKRIEAMPSGPELDKVEVLVRSAAPVPYRDVIRVHEALERAGIKKVGLGVGK
jgi:biopolymer transport protein ExbD